MIDGRIRRPRRSGAAAAAARATTSSGWPRSTSAARQLDLAAHTVSVAEIVTRDGRVRAARDAQGVVDLTTLTLRPRRPPPRPRRAAAPSASRPPARPPPDWTVGRVTRFDLEKWGARFDDRAVAPTAVVTVDPIALHVTDLSTAPGAKLGVDLRLGVNKTGRLQITGTSTLPPVTANLRFDLRALELLPLQPYFQDQVSLTVTDGTVSVKGQAAVKMPATGAPQMNVNADIDVADLATVDRDRHEPLVGWKSFHVGGAERRQPADDGGDRRRVARPTSRRALVLRPDGRSNLEEAFAKPGAPAPAKRPAKPAKTSGAKPAATVARAPPRPPSGPRAVRRADVDHRSGRSTCRAARSRSPISRSSPPTRRR